jgi:hypothetical protein
VSEWGYVAAAFTLVWASLAVYAIALARRVNQAERVDESLREAVEAEDATACDVQPAP